MFYCVMLCYDMILILVHGSLVIASMKQWGSRGVRVYVRKLFDAVSWTVNNKSSKQREHNGLTKKRHNRVNKPSINNVVSQTVDKHKRQECMEAWRQKLWDYCKKLNWVMINLYFCNFEFYFSLDLLDLERQVFALFTCTLFLYWFINYSAYYTNTIFSFICVVKKI